MTETQRLTLTRRWFLAVTGAGVATGFLHGAARALAPAGATLGDGYAPTVWYTVDEHGHVRVHVSMAEMGQHVGTALARVVAEELEADWDDVSFVHVDTDPKWGYMVTGGSWSVNHNFFKLSRAGAAGRIALVEAGAKMMGVAAEECRARNSRVLHADRSVSYGEIVAAGAVERQFTEDELKAIALKPAAERRLLNRDTSARDVPEKVTGAATYGIDRTVEGMVYARPVMPPVRFGSTIAAWNDGAAKEIPGYIRTIEIDDPTGTCQGWLAVVAETWPAASKAADLIEVSYDGGSGLDVDEDMLFAEGERLVDDPDAGEPFFLDGDAKQALEAADTVHEGLYRTGTVLHMQLEPANALVWRDGDTWRVHAGNQWQSLTLPLVAEALGVEQSKLVFETSYLGGGFGRRLYCDFIVPAALVAKEIGRPVKMVFARTDDTKLDCPRAPSVHLVRSVTREDGGFAAYDHSCASGWSTAPIAPQFLIDSADGKGKIDPFAISGGDHWYAADTVRVRSIKNELVHKTFLPGNLRSVGPGYMGWAVETHVDEVAHALGRDPAEYRLSLLDAEGRNAGEAPHAIGGAARLRKTLERVMALSDWSRRSGLPDGAGLGVSATTGQERGMPTWISTVAQVRVDRESGEVTAERIWAVADAGTLAHPDGALAQIQGAILWGLSMALHEGTAFREGLPGDLNLDTYTPLRMHQLPEVEIEFLENDYMPVGLGEPGVIGVGPAIGNAIFDAVGARLREIPIRPDAVLKAMEA